LPPEKIELNQLRLRRPKVSDAVAIFEYGSDPIVAHYADWPVRTTLESLVESLQQRDARWGSSSEFTWVITSLMEDQAIGGLSCEINVESAEIGFLLNRKYWGRGIALEAAAWVVDWLLSHSDVSKVIATCDTENSRSIRVLDKLGFALEETLYRAVERPQISPEPRDAYLYSCSEKTDVVFS